MTSINWGLLHVPAYQESFDRAFEAAGKARERNALGRVIDNPDDAEAMRDLTMRNPELGLKMRDYRRQEQGRNALMDLLGGDGQASALPFNPRGTPIMPQRNALDPTVPVAGNQAQIPTSMGPPAGAPPRQPSNAPDISLRNPAFRQFMAIDPDQATKIASLYSTMSKADRERETHKMGMVGSLAMHLKSFPEEQRHQEMMRLAPQLRASGFTDDDLDDNDLSDAGLQGLTALAMDVKTILGQQRADRRLEWDIEDDEIDNARADRNTDSLVGARQASTAQGWQRVGIQREGMTRTDARGRRGQDIQSADRRRGQDMTDQRIRQGYTGGRRTSMPSVPAGANIPAGSPLSPTNEPLAVPPPRQQRQQPRTRPQAGDGRIAVNPKTGQKLQLVNGKWVPVR